MGKSSLGRKDITLMVKWCKIKFGESEFIDEELKIRIRKGKDKYGVYQGIYDGPINTMIINPRGSLINICDTVIHEYIHYLQDMWVYNELLEEYGYEDHPQEIEAETIAEKYKWDLRRYFKENRKI